MKVLSLRQPFASLLIHGIKRWETRGWKPGARNMKIIQRDGLLIHATLTKKDAHLMGSAPFSNHLSILGQLPYGCIIGKIRIGRIIKTQEWCNENMSGLFANQEFKFGNYSPNRWAWEVIEPEPISHIPWRGALSLWEFAFTEEEKNAQAARDYGQPWENNW